MSSQTHKIWFFRSLKARLLFFVITVSLIPLAVVAYSLNTQASKALDAATSHQLLSVSDVQSRQVERYFVERLRDVEALSKHPTTVKAVNEMCQGCHIDTGQELGNEPALAYVRNQYLGQPELVDAGDGFAYSAAHAQYHPLFQAYKETYGYEDVFLVGAHHGNIIYSSLKKDDFATSLLTGQYSDTMLGQILRNSLEANDPDFTRVKDFAYYEPSDGPTSFVASPIFDDTQMVGVLVLQLSIEQINRTMRNVRGMGESGESYLVGPDNLMRSDSRFFEESTIFKQRVNTTSANRGLAGGTGVMRTLNYRGDPVLSAYRPLDIPGVDWVMISEIDEAEAFAATEAMRETSSSTITIAAPLVLLLSVLISLSIVNPIILITKIATRLSNGDTELEGLNNKRMRRIMRRKDELGAIGRAFNALIDYLKEMSTAAQRLASGDLTVEVQPRSEVDMLGNAFAQMLVDLKKLVGQVISNANQVAVASAQLSSTAHDAGNMSNQIATTIEQVAKGIVEQTNSTSMVTYSMADISRTIDNVASGAQEQSQATIISSTVTSQINQAIQQIAINAQNGAQDAVEASKLALDGSQVVQSAVQSMYAIREKVQVSSKKVHQMDNQSKEIGAIIQTIDDIAYQTKMLALNASIEAARAGEQGKGFAVVAAEIRKLATTAATSTKEIAGLLWLIQKSIAESVEAMDEGGP